MSDVVGRAEVLMKKPHSIDVDDEEKLKKKDATLKAALPNISAMIQQADHMPQGTARILLTMVGA